MFNFFKKPKRLVIAAAIIAVVVFGVIKSRAPKKPAYDYITVKKIDIIQEVSVTGKVKPVSRVDLAFEKSGKVNAVYVKVGQQAVAATPLIALENDDLRAQLNSARAGTEIAQAQLKNYQAALLLEQTKLEELKKGARAEEIKIAETKVKNAEQNLKDAEETLKNTFQKLETDLANLYDDVKDILADAHSKSEDALNQQIDELFYREQKVKEFNLEIGDSILKNEIEGGYSKNQNDLKKLQTLIEALNDTTSYENLDAALADAELFLSQLQIFLNKITEALNKNTLSGISSATLNTYKTNTNTARTNINTALTAISSQKQLIAAQKRTNQNNVSSAQTAVNTAQSALSLAQDELSLKKAGSTQDQIKLQQARVAQAKAALAAQAAQLKQASANTAQMEAQFRKTILISPLNGIVTRVEIEAGEIVSPNASVISIMSSKEFLIEAFVPEADIAKLKISSGAVLTLDAYGGDELFEAKVTAIDPAETVKEGVSTYKTTLEFSKEDDRIKSGMTADISILSAKREAVLAVPVRAVINQDGEKFVRVIRNDGTIDKVKVKTGLRGSDGNIEITEGIEEGDKVIIFEK